MTPVTERRLVILRHAKAEPPERYDRDIDRPLSGRGRRDASAAGVWLARAGLSPDLVLSSPAVRTRETWRGVAAALDVEPPVRYEPVLYSHAVLDVLDRIRAAPDDAVHVLVIGHNPTLSMLSRLLDRDGTGDELRTCGLAVHRVDSEWTELQAGTARLVDSHTARG